MNWLKLKWKMLSRLRIIDDSQFKLHIKGFCLRKYSGCCPEQWEVYKSEELVGFLRLRNGIFSVYNEATDEKIFSIINCEGGGMFKENERRKYLTIGVRELNNWLNKGKH